MPRKSSVKSLPPDLKDMVDRLLREDRETQTAILALVNGELDRRGADPISMSAFNRYAQAMEKAGARIRQTREIAAVWVAELGEEPKGEVGRLLAEVIRTLAFDTASTITEGDAPAAPKEVMALARAVRDLEHAASLSAEREMKIRRDTAEKAAKAAAGVARTAGLTAETVDKIRRGILGVADGRT